MNALRITAPTTLEEAVKAFSNAEEAMYLSGGMTLVPSMKARLASPDLLVDLSGIAEMTGISETPDGLRIGAMTRLAEIANSPVVRAAIPELAQMVTLVADRHVRNRGTVGGSVANNDPAADLPAAVIGLGATLITDRRRISADDYFQGLFSTALEPGEILTAIELPKPEIAAYAKHAHPASGYAVAGVFVARFDNGWRVAVTGSGIDGVFRLIDLEQALAEHDPEQALELVDFDAIEVLDEPAFPAPFRRSALRWLTREALRRTAG